MTRAANDSWLALPDLASCGRNNPYLECHVEPACLYGERAGRESPIFLRRYYDYYHPGIDIAKRCKTVVVVSAENPGDHKDVGDYFVDLPAVVKIRVFNASGWIDPAHFSIGVRFLVGQKIVMLQADDGFTDDDDWVYGSEGKFPVFNATFAHEETTRNGAKTIRVSVKAQVYDGHRYHHYERPYRRGQPADREIDRGYFGQPAREEEFEEGEKAKKPEAAELTAVNISPAGTAIGMPPLFTTIVCSAGALLATGAMAYLVYSLVVKKRRDAERAQAHAPPTWSSDSQETDVLIVDANGEIRTVTARSP